jgi:hypothetical protein
LFVGIDIETDSDTYKIYQELERKYSQCEFYSINVEESFGLFYDKDKEFEERILATIELPKSKGISVITELFELK